MVVQVFDYLNGSKQKLQHKHAGEVRFCVAKCQLSKHWLTLCALARAGDWFDLLCTRQNCYFLLARYDHCRFGRKRPREGLHAEGNQGVTWVAGFWWLHLALT